MAVENILFISSNKKLQQLATLILESEQMSKNLVFASSISEAIGHLRSQWCVIFLGHNLTLDQPINELAKELKPYILSKETQIIGTNAALKTKEWAYYISQLSQPELITLQIAEQINKDEKSIDFFPIKLTSLLDFSEFPFNVYVKIIKNKEPRFLKIYNRGDDMYFDDIQKYKDKNIEYVYIAKEKSENVVAQSTEAVQKDDSEDLHIEPAEVMKMAIDYTVDLLTKSGFKIADTFIARSLNAFKEMDSIIEKNEEHKHQLRTLLNKETNFFIKHVSMCSIVSCYMLDLMIIGDTKYKEKLCIAANMQNIFLETEDELKFNSMEQINHFDEEHRKRILEHAKMASDLLSENYDFDTDILKIIRCHHGDEQGLSFPEQISSFNKVYSVFQVATLFSQLYLIQLERFGKVDLEKVFSLTIKKIDIKYQGIVTSLKNSINLIEENS